MKTNFRVLLLFLGTGVVSVWAAVLFLFFFNDQPPIKAETHRKAQIGTTENKEMAFDGEPGGSGSVYAIHKQKKYHPGKLSNINITNESGKVSIDRLLEELKLQ
ncbi:hypothetical protein [Lentibacillus salicampi]|uniref:Uncharacterized protein n=1 Tax=Lentibacillus salicampi TaxID=175306 RepID=A0A4Y9A9K0_9BACI|nr:hypothetical protein [Lentibacillus salicampi]TFJ92556.1 hypothetical protein E4U82_11490 [Lentibacillus salicampi]